MEVANSLASFLSFGDFPSYFLRSFPASGEFKLNAAARENPLLRAVFFSSGLVDVYPTSFFFDHRCLEVSSFEVPVGRVHGPSQLPFLVLRRLATFQSNHRFAYKNRKPAVSPLCGIPLRSHLPPCRIPVSFFPPSYQKHAFSRESNTSEIRSLFDRRILARIPQWTLPPVVSREVGILPSNRGLELLPPLHVSTSRTPDPLILFPFRPHSHQELMGCSPGLLSWTVP